MDQFTPAVNCVPGGSLGSGDDLRVLLTSKGGTRILAEFFPMSGDFTRVIDLTSELTMTISSSGRGGTESWDLLAPWATEILVLRDGRDAWCGPVIEVKFNIGSADVKARDITAWWSRRIIPKDMQFENMDVSQVLIDLHQAAMAADPIPNFFINAPASGVTVSREYIYVQSTYVKDAIDELSKSVLDWTAYGRTVYAGGAEISDLPPITLYDDMWMKPPQVHARGASQATSITINAKENILGKATAPQEYLDYYGLIERIFDEADIETQDDANAAAASRLQLLQDPYYIESPAGAALKPTAPLTVPQLVPGVRVNVMTEATGKKLVGEFRLQQVKVQFDGEVYVDLQPIGSVDDSSV